MNITHDNELGTPIEDLLGKIQTLVNQEHNDQVLGSKIRNLLK